MLETPWLEREHEWHDSGTEGDEVVGRFQPLPAREDSPGLALTQQLTGNQLLSVTLAGQEKAGLLSGCKLHSSAPC